MLALEAFLISLLQALPNVPLVVGAKILTGVADLFGGVILLITGVLVIVLVVAAAIVLLPAIIVAVLVWFLTGSFFYAGIAFLAVALISIIAVADDE
jgi:hypothetical protein